MVKLFRLAVAAVTIGVSTVVSLPHSGHATSQAGVQSAAMAATTRVSVTAIGKMVITALDGGGKIRLYTDEASNEYVVESRSWPDLSTDSPTVCYNESPKIVRCARNAVSRYSVLNGQDIEVYPDWTLAGKIWLGTFQNRVYLSGNRWTTITGRGSAIDYVIFYYARHGVTVSLDGLHNDGITGNPKVNVAANIEAVGGGPYADVLIGNDRPNNLTGFGGADQLYGLGRHDNLEAIGPGTFADGGDGFDYCLSRIETRINCEDQ